MKTYQLTIAGDQCTIHYCETQEDFHRMQQWVGQHQDSALACDTETTGLGVFNTGFRVRLIQIGDSHTAWCVPTHPEWFDSGFLQHPRLVLQNAAYDIQALQQSLGVTIPWDRVVDTKILAHLVDPRSVKEGGPGLSLQELTHHYIDPEVAAEIKGSMKHLAKEAGCTVGEVFQTIPVDNDAYLVYAGADVLLTHRLYNILLGLIPPSAVKLIRYEHEVARVCCEMSTNGFLLDVGYAQQHSQELLETQQGWEAVAYAEYGVESVNSNAEVAEALQETGVRLTERTASGNLKVDKTILQPLADQGHRLAIAVLASKAAKKQRATWVDTFLQQRDPNNRCHANIQPLQARTGRMSITGIPAQTLPSDDWRIRRCFIPEPGQVIVSCDYQTQELRVLAALSGDENMIEAFRENKDLHQITADASGVERSVGKTVNFAYVYGSGPGNIAKTCGISVPKAKQVIRGFEQAYPRVKQLSERLQKQARKDGYVTTPTGRRLPVDKDRAYSALNYMIQSTSRDITAAALLRLDAAGFTPYLRLPIHDEIVASLPEEHAESGMRRIAEIMATDFNGVHIGTDAENYGLSWGGGYVTSDETTLYQNTLRA